MTDSLRDQLLGLGFKPAAKPAAARKEHMPRSKGNAPERKQASRAKPGKPPTAGAVKPANGEMDLARAYAMRAQTEQAERLQAEQQKQEEARLRREARAKVAEYLTPERILNAGDAADIARNFEYGGKIKRIYVTSAQLVKLNAGELGVVQQNGRYLLVSAKTLSEVEAQYPAAVALKVNPHTAVPDDPYADPKYQVPDDLVW